VRAWFLISQALDERFAVLQSGLCAGFRCIGPCRFASLLFCSSIQVESLAAGSNRYGDTQVLPFSIAFYALDVAISDPDIQSGRELSCWVEEALDRAMRRE
jgi:hypothetical protein